MQETTRQDRHLEALAEQSTEAVRNVNVMISAVGVLIGLMLFLLLLLDFMRRRSARDYSIDKLALPLAEDRT